jgi:hypothetical protein
MTDPRDRFRWRPGDVRPLVSLYLEPEEARLLRTILTDFAETFEDCEEEADRVAVAAKIAEAIGEALR